MSRLLVRIILQSNAHKSFPHLAQHSDPFDSRVIASWATKGRSHAQIDSAARTPQSRLKPLCFSSGSRKGCCMHPVSSRHLKDGFGSASCSAPQTSVILSRARSNRKKLRQKVGIGPSPSFRAKAIGANDSTISIALVMSR